jgi:Kef-type K+ transport system membrane component KefB
VLSHWFPAYFPIRDPVLIFAIVLVLFLSSPIAMARLRLPGMIGLLLAGAILGPHALGILARDASFVLLGAVGLIYIMFTAALEVDLSAFRKHGVHSVIFGILTFSLPQGLGALVGHYVLRYEWPAAILLASMIASHTLLAYPIVSRLGLASTKPVTATVGGTMITDTASLLVLAVIAGMTTGEVNEAFWWRLGVSLVVFVAAILIGLPILGRRFFRRFHEDGPGQFVFVLTSVFLCAALSNVAGLEPIVGAFLAGLALNRLIPHQSPLMNRLMFTGEAIFIPFFLLSVGMLLDARVLFGGLETWAVAIGMTVTVVVTKYLAAGAARVLFRFRKEEARVIFGLSVVQAAATLASVMVGNRIGLFDDAVVNGTIIMILVTCILGPAVVAKYAPAMAAAAAAAPKEVKGARGVLVPLLSARQAEPSMELALLLRADKKEPIYPAFVASEGGDVAQSMAEADKILAAAVAQASAADCPVEPVKRVHNDPGRTLVRTRKELGAAHVVVPWDAAPSQNVQPAPPGTSEPPPSVLPTGQARLGHVVDELTADAGVNVFLSRLPRPLGTCSRVVLMVPPGVIGGASFDDGAHVLAHVCKALGSAVLAIGSDQDVGVIRETLVRGAELRVEIVHYASSRAWLPLMTDHVKASDLVILWGLRESDPAFSAEYRDFGVRVFARYPDSDVVVFYPRTKTAEASLVTPAPEPAPTTQPMPQRTGTVMMRPTGK